MRKMFGRVRKWVRLWWASRNDVYMDASKEREQMWCRCFKGVGEE